MNKPKRHHIADLLDLKKLDVIGQKTIDVMRAQGLVIEPRKKEIRYVPGTTLIPHFAFKNASKNEMTTEAIALKFLIEKTIKINTISKKDYEDAIIQAEKEESDKTKSKTVTKVTKKTTAKK